MKTTFALSAFEAEAPKGIQRVRRLPDAALGDLWDSIIIDPEIKSQLLSQAVLNFTIRGKVSRTVLPLHGVILLTGEPGTGKSSLARGLAHRTAKAFNSDAFKLMEVEPHSLTSSGMGKTQKAVSELFSQAISEAATAGPTIVLLDEVETLAVDRSKLSMDANPIDVHRATDAVLVQLDALAEQHTNLLFLATSNFPEAVDTAFISRADLVLKIPLPNKEACRQILHACIMGLAKAYPAVASLTQSARFDQCAAECVGLDGRAIRKMVANALARRTETAMDPSRVTPEDLLAAAQAAKLNRSLGAKSK
jgi:AAA+ superfamily predicted ATPase